MLDQLERSEAEAKRIEQYMTTSGVYNSSDSPRRSTSVNRPTRDQYSQQASSPGREEGDNASVDSDFPPTLTTSQHLPTSQQGQPTDPSSQLQQPQQHTQGSSTSPNRAHRSTSGGMVNKVFGRLSYAIQGVTDQDPERARRDALGKTKESLGQLEQAVVVAQSDVKDASQGVLADLRRFQAMKEGDLRGYMVSPHPTKRLDAIILIISCSAELRTSARRVVEAEFGGVGEGERRGGEN